MIDYSKWDKLELSDDSDVEVHPNVDKKSFIRMRQRQIHEERVKRDHDIKLIKVQTEMYTHLNERVDKMLLKLSDEELLDEDKRNSFLSSNFDPNEKTKQEEIQDTPTYNEMIEDLFTQIFSDNTVRDGQHLRQLVVQHRKKIDDVSTQNHKKLDELLEQKSHHITSEDLHTGFDSSFLNKEQIKKQSEAEQKKVQADKKKTDLKKTTQIETLNAPSVDSKSVDSEPDEKAVSTTSKPKSDKEELQDLQLYPETENFGKISAKDYPASAKFLRTNPFVIKASQKDALLMKAFDFQLKNDSTTAKNIVHQSLIIQYISDLTGKNAPIAQVEKGVGIFFQKIMEDNSLLLKETDSTFEHIKNRCEILKKENSNLTSLDGDNEGQEEQIQLKSLDPNSQLTVNIPDPKVDATKYNEFVKLPENMKKAVETGSLEEINNVFASMKINDAEEVLEIFEKSGVIGIQAVLENEDEWENMKENYNGNDENATIELRSTDPNAELVVLPPPSQADDAEAYAAFSKLLPELQNAVSNQSLDEVNEVFSKLNNEQSNEMLHLLELSAVLGLHRKQNDLADEVD